MSIKKITSENIVFEGQLTIFLILCKCNAVFFNMLKNSNKFGSCDVMMSISTQCKVHSQPAFACSRLTIETLEQGVKFVQS